jgi:hypothetical protein
VGYAELARDELPRQLPARQKLEAIANSATKARTLVRQILTFSRMAEGRKRPLSVKALADAAAPGSGRARGCGRGGAALSLSRRRRLYGRQPEGPQDRQAWELGPYQ